MYIVSGLVNLIMYIQYTLFNGTYCVVCKFH